MRRGPRWGWPLGGPCCVAISSRSSALSWGLALRGLSRVNVGWSRGLVLVEGSRALRRGADEQVLAKDREREMFGGHCQRERSHQGRLRVTELLRPRCPHP